MSAATASAFKPRAGLRNRHLQSLLASAKWRVPLMKHRLKPMLRAAIDEVWSDGSDVVLHSLYAKQPEGQASELVVLIHGWEGSHESVYMRSASSACFAAGYDVLCLNLRDHGPSHSFNEGLFHAQRLDETVGVLRSIMRDTNYRHYHLAGFSLGGNFALRVAASLSADDKPDLSSVQAICPVVNPAATFSAMATGPAFYTRYFLKKWKRSLNRKIQHFPELMKAEDVEAFSSLEEMTQHLVAAHTPFEDVASYFESYRLTSALLDTIRIPSHIIWAKDDPVIPLDEHLSQTAGDYVNIEIAQWGGHCGFVEDYRLNSYLDRWILRKLGRYC